MKLWKLKMTSAYEADKVETVEFWDFQTFQHQLYEITCKQPVEREEYATFLSDATKVLETKTKYRCTLQYGTKLEISYTEVLDHPDVALAKELVAALEKTYHIYLTEREVLPSLAMGHCLKPLRDYQYRKAIG
jgi:hypothetical protein